MLKSACKHLGYFVEFQDVSILPFRDADERDAHFCCGCSFLGVFNACGVAAVELPAVVFDGELCLGPVKIVDKASSSGDFGRGFREGHRFVERWRRKILPPE